MKILFSSSPAHGLLFPLVPTAWALRAAGHEVLVAAPESLARTVAGAGLPFTASAPALDVGVVMNAERDGTPIPRPTAEPELVAHIGRGFGKIAALTVDRMLTQVDSWRPDLIVSEHHEYAAPIAAALRGIPWVKHGIGLGCLPVVDETGFAELAPELDRLGLTDVPHPDLEIDTCPPSVAALSGPGVLPMRYLPYNNPGPVPAWPQEGAERRRVCLTLGTRVPLRGGMPLLAELARSLPDLGVELIIALADEHVPRLGPLPAGVRAGWYPLDELVAGCDAVVHQCGSGTVMAALVAGVPQVTIPYIAEQRDMARRLAAAGAAPTVHPDGIRAEDVFRACAAVLTEPLHRTRSQALAAEIAAMPTPADRVEDLAALAA